MDILKEIAVQVDKGNYQEVESQVRSALDQKIPVEEILYQGLVAGMNIIGEKFKNNECFIPEVLVAARAMTSGLNILEPLMAEARVASQGKVVMGSIQGDLHDIGKNIVGMLLKGAGFEIIDLGADVPISRFVETAKNQNADMIGMSSLLTTTMVNMQPVIEGLKVAGIRDKVKVIIGGAPITREFAERIGADGFAPDAASAVDLAKGLLNN